MVNSKPTDLFCAAFLCHGDDFAARSAPDDAVIDQEDVFAGEFDFHGVELAPDALFPHLLAGHWGFQRFHGFVR